MEKIIITSPSLDLNKNVSGVSAITGFIIQNNSGYTYKHFELGKLDGEKRNLNWFFRTLKAWVLWFWLMIRHRHILVHFNLALTLRSIVRDLPLIVFAQLLNKKMVIHLHGGEYLEEKKPPRWAAVLLKWCFSGKKPKIVLSPTEKMLITARFNARNVHVLPNCIDLTDARNFDGTKQASPPLKLLFIGRIDRNKGLEYILRALTTLKEKEEVSFRFFMAGTGPDKEYYVEKFTEQLGDSFVYQGVVSGDEKAALFRSCHLFLLPSMYEGLPISLLENMSYGNVPVVTNVGSIGSIVTHAKNGIVVKKESAEEITAAIEKLSRNSGLLNELAANARKQIFADFNPENYIKKLGSIYEEALTRRPVHKAPALQTSSTGNLQGYLHKKLEPAVRFFNYLKKHKIFFTVFGYGFLFPAKTILICITIWC